MAIKMWDLRGEGGGGGPNITVISVAYFYTEVSIICQVEVDII